MVHKTGLILFFFKFIDNPFSISVHQELTLTIYMYHTVFYG